MNFQLYSTPRLPSLVPWSVSPFVLLYFCKSFHHLRSLSFYPRGYRGRGRFHCPILIACVFAVLFALPFPRFSHCLLDSRSHRLCFLHMLEYRSIESLGSLPPFVAAVACEIAAPLCSCFVRPDPDPDRFMCFPFFPFCLSLHHPPVILFRSFAFPLHPIGRGLDLPMPSPLEIGGG